MAATLLVGGGVAAYLVAPLWDTRPVLAVTNWLAVVAFALTAQLVADDHEHERGGDGWLFLGCAIFWAAGLLGTREVGPLPLLEYTFGSLVFVFVTAVLLRYPQRRLTRRPERVFVGVLLCWLLVGRLVTVVTSDPTWLGYPDTVWWPTLFPSRAVSETGGTVYFAGALVLAIVFVVLIVARLRRTRGIDRRMLAPVVVAAAAVGLIGVTDAAARFVVDDERLMANIFSVEAIVMLAVPFAFLVSAVRRRLARAAVADLVLGVGRSASVEVVRAELRRVLCDPALEVLFWVPEADGYVDVNGQPADLQATGRSFVKTVESTDGLPLAAVVGDRSLERYARLVDSAVAAIGLALENARLQARVLAQLEQVRASRARIVEAGLSERRRLERDLHDGAQQRLLGIAMHLAAVPATTTDQVTLGVVKQAREELHTALGELRDLAHGIHPAVLTQGGLVPALESVVERLPLPVELDVPARRWEAAVEATIYFVTCEALSNAVKHAGATRADVVVRSRGHDVLVRIADNGAGGAEVSDGGGLAGLHDRVAALGGRMTVTSASGAGTQVEARIPCG